MCRILPEKWAIYTYIGRGNLPHVTLVNNQRTVQEDVTSEYISEKKKRNSKQVISKNNRREMAHRFQIVREIRREYSRFNTIGTQMTVRLNPPTDPEINPVDHFLASVNDLFEHALQDVGDADMVGVAIHNEVNQSDRPIGISFRRRDQLSVDAIWSVFEKVTQSNSRFNALDTMTVVLHSVKMPVGFGFHSAGMKTKGRPLSVMAHLKKSIIQVKTETN